MPHVLTKEDAMSCRLLTVTLITAFSVFATQSYAETKKPPKQGATTSRSGWDIGANKEARMGKSGGGGGKGAVQRPVSIKLEEISSRKTKTTPAKKD
jgi:hypothetical protein